MIKDTDYLHSTLLNTVITAQPYQDTHNLTKNDWLLDDYMKVVANQTGIAVGGLEDMADSCEAFSSYPDELAKRDISKALDQLENKGKDNVKPTSEPPELSMDNRILKYLCGPTLVEDFLPQELKKEVKEEKELFGKV